MTPLKQSVKWAINIRTLLLPESEAEATNRELICPLCSDVFRDPRSCTQGHVFCYECLAARLHVTPNGSVCECPICKCTLSAASFGRNPRIQKDVDKLKWRCQRVDQGCDTIVTMETWRAHHRVCPFRPANVSDMSQNTAIDSETDEAGGLTQECALAVPRGIAHGPKSSNGEGRTSPPLQGHPGDCRRPTPSQSGRRNQVSTKNGSKKNVSKKNAVRRANKTNIAKNSKGSVKKISKQNITSTFRNPKTKGGDSDSDSENSREVTNVPVSSNSQDSAWNKSNSCEDLRFKNGARVSMVWETEDGQKVPFVGTIACIHPTRQDDDGDLLPYDVRWEDGSVTKEWDDQALIPVVESGLTLSSEVTPLLSSSQLSLPSSQLSPPSSQSSPPSSQSSSPSSQSSLPSSLPLSSFSSSLSSSSSTSSSSCSTPTSPLPPEQPPAHPLLSYHSPSQIHDINQETHATCSDEHEGDIHEIHSEKAGQSIRKSTQHANLKRKRTATLPLQGQTQLEEERPWKVPRVAKKPSSSSLSATTPHVAKKASSPPSSAVVPHVTKKPSSSSSSSSAVTVSLDQMLANMSIPRYPGGDIPPESSPSSNTISAIITFPAPSSDSSSVTSTQQEQRNCVLKRKQTEVRPLQSSNQPKLTLLQQTDNNYQRKRQHQPVQRKRQEQQQRQQQWQQWQQPQQQQQQQKQHLRVSHLLASKKKVMWVDLPAVGTASNLVTTHFVTKWIQAAQQPPEDEEEGQEENHQGINQRAAQSSSSSLIPLANFLVDSSNKSNNSSKPQHNRSNKRKKPNKPHHPSNSSSNTPSKPPHKYSKGSKFIPYSQQFCVHDGRLTQHVRNKCQTPCHISNGCNGKHTIGRHWFSDRDAYLAVRAISDAAVNQ